MCIELACQTLDHQEAEELRADISRVFRSSHVPKPSLAKEELKALAELRKDSNRSILTADKGATMVVMDRKDYTEKATNLLAQQHIELSTGTQLTNLKLRYFLFLAK